ncbi:BLUF domain-containing protein [uncultured Sphingomonas sp.]|uniref:BLUF domain-containing protein n=1 Tax=uncultured Sphingomonas sp. TaxID=158754 RepID=UPI0025EDCC89|nr:BLUF domain-containing protein [uncultured Sphingomonas sp.]
MRRLIYRSVYAGQNWPNDLFAIVHKSRRNNALCGITGLLWADFPNFIQIIEGAPDTVEATYQRIAADPRHWNVEILSDREILAREFAGWSLASFPFDDPEEFAIRLTRLIHLGELSQEVIEIAPRQA